MNAAEQVLKILRNKASSPEASRVYGQFAALNHILNPEDIENDCEVLCEQLGELGFIPDVTPYGPVQTTQSWTRRVNGKYIEQIERVTTFGMTYSLVMERTEAA